MLSTPHLLVGAAIVKAIPNPLISLPLAFASHFVLDSIPHWDGSPKPPFGRKFFILVAIDYFIGLTLVWWFARSNPNLLLILLGGFMGTAPDFLMGSFRNFKDLPWNKWGWYIKFNDFHRSIQRQLPPAGGFVTAIIAIGIAAFVLTRI